MKPMRRARHRVRATSDIDFRDSPSIWASPSSISSRPERQLEKRGLCAAGRPMIATISPLFDGQVHATQGMHCTLPVLYCLTTPVLDHSRCNSYLFSHPLTLMRAKLGHWRPLWAYLIHPG